MNSTIVINKIFLDNYKLFENFTLDLKNGLNIFDGPNGYGKTSLFDAVEFLITGDIKRVTTCEVLDGKYKYQKVFFAKDYKKDVIIKAEFCKNDKIFVLVKKIEGHKECNSSIDNNPKKLKEITKTYLVYNFDDIEYSDEYLVPLEELKKMQTELFGKTSQTLYTLLYYIQQEDRLAYFKNNETGRMGSINSLFQIDDENQKLKSIQSAKKKISDLVKYLEKQIAELQESLYADFENESGAQVKYRKLLKKDVVWDVEEPIISSPKSLEHTLHILDGVKEIVLNQEQLRNDLKNSKYNNLLNNAMLETQLKAYIIMRYIQDDIEKYIESKKKLLFLKKESKKIKDLDYINIEYQQIGKYVDKADVCDKLVQKVLEYRKIEKNVQQTQQSINEMIRIREQLMKTSEEENIFEDGKCPYCGYVWQEKEQLLNNIEKTTNDVNSLLGTTGKQMKEIVDTISETFLQNVWGDAEVLISDLESNVLLSAFMEFDESDIVQKYKYIEKFLKDNMFEISLTDEFSVNNMEKNSQQIQNVIKNEICVLPEEYYQKKNEYQFDSLLKEYFLSIEEVAELKEGDIVQKAEFLKYKFIIQERDKSKKIENLKRKKECIEGEISKKLNQYMKDWKASIDKYQGNIISQVEIPFYIYSARILQSYQGGQGILIRDKNGKEELNSIRFTTPNEEHDILYTMSSGQLSGILLAFSLALHKIFINAGLNIMLIDDPVQCMDDLNIVSFVELIRTEFPNVQFLISTHENSFAGYIGYKYKKYNLPVQRCNLKEISTL